MHAQILSQCRPCTSGRQIVSQAPRRQSTRSHRLQVACAEGFCRDKVNIVNRERSTEGDTEVQVTFLGVNGIIASVPCSTGGYILDAGLEAGLELPYTCKAGICGTCVGRVQSGEVDQTDIADLSFCLNEDEIKQGMALLCMSRPVKDCSIETQSDWGYGLGVTEWQGASGHLEGKQVDKLM